MRDTVVTSEGCIRRSNIFYTIHKIVLLAQMESLVQTTSSGVEEMNDLMSSDVWGRGDEGASEMSSENDALRPTPLVETPRVFEEGASSGSCAAVLPSSMR